MEHGVREVAARLGRVLVDKGWLLSTAESCTGGLVASSVTDIPGSSAWFVGGAVTYSNAVKQALLGVPGTTLAAKGAVSEETVRAMVTGVRGLFHADVALATSGIAGPDGGSPQKPVGTVWMAWDGPFGLTAKLHHFTGSRLEIKAQSALTALETLLQLLEGVS